jgi:energy-coupling factor transport system substrate-specific component
LVFGAFMNLHQWINYSGDHSLAKLVATFGTALPFDLAHAAGNVVFALAFGPALVNALARFRTRFDVVWVR